MEIAENRQGDFPFFAVRKICFALEINYCLRGGESLSLRWQLIVYAEMRVCLRGDRSFCHWRKGKINGWYGCFSRGVVSLAECELCLTQRAQDAQRHASFLLRVATGGGLFFLTTDYTDYTDFSFAVPSQVQRAAISFICAIC